jgi:hypothetical protein
VNLQRETTRSSNTSSSRCAAEILATARKPSMHARRT